MTTPSVIVATEQEQTVRLYVGAPSNGGMHQVAQLSTAHPIDPHDLADMAMSLSVQFGWLESTHEVGTAPAKLEAPALPPVANATSYTPRMAQMVACPVKGCGHVARRKNLSQHLMSGRHLWKRDDANRAARNAKAVDAPPELEHSEPAKAVKPKRTKPKSANSLGIPANMRYGLVGRRELERVGYPKILAFAEVRGHVSSKMVAKHFGESTSAAKHWLNQLQQRGDLVRVNPDAQPNEEHLYALAQRESQHVGFGHEHEAHTNPIPIHNTESESQSV